MMITNYSEFDKSLLSHIGEGPKLFASLVTLTEKQAQPFVKHGEDLFRIADRRLQALRKKGLIKFDRKKGWSLANA